MSAINVTRLLTRKTALGESRTVDTVAEPLGDADALFRIDRFALTTNNITYAAFGDAMDYWKFFRSDDAEWGQMPVWGFAEVVASKVEGLAVGERFYGYFPIASHLRMSPIRVTPRGFYDGAAHRAALTSAYNHYVRCSVDPAYSPALENYQALVRPLFITSFMGADFLQDNKFFGATQLVVSSASSKTAYGTAFCLAGEPGVELIALTSPRNHAFVESLGCYHRALNYDAVTSIAAARPTLYLDFSGDEKLRAAIHHHFGDSLVYDCYAGSAQNTDFLRKLDLPGPEPKFYFAPVQIKKRNKDWGHDEVNRRYNEAQSRFIQKISDPARPWMRVVESHGFPVAERLIADLVAGRSDPQAGNIVVLGGQ